MFDVMVTKCRDVDIDEKPFDTALYDKIKAGKAYGYSPDYSWIPFLKGEFATAERQLAFGLECDGTDELRQRLSATEASKRCLMAIDKSDISHWSSTTMYEFYDPGYFYDDIKSHLTASRLFVDLPAQQAATDAMLPSLQVMVDEIKETISERVNAVKSNEDAVSDILGAGN